MSSDNRVEELLEDAKELNVILATIATRPRVKELLKSELSRVENEISKLQNSEKPENTSTSVVSPPPISTEKKITAGLPQKISSYAWDQSDKFMKIYASLNGVQTLGEERIKCEFGPKSFKLSVQELNNKNYELYISTLLEEIVPSESYHKVKTDKILIMLKKKTTGKTWAYVTQREKSKSDKTKPKMDDDADPQDSIMNLMKQMYDDGDDEMKRTIAKAWTESRDKKKGEP